MNSQATTDLLEIVGNPHNSLSNRLRTLQDLGASNDKTLIASLKSLLRRPRPETQQKHENWDPEAAERMVDLYIVAALHKLGDDTELKQIPITVAQAGQVLQDPKDELSTAAAVILEVGRLEPISDLVGMTSGGNPAVIRNAAKTLDQLNLPEAPVGGSVAPAPHMHEKVSFTIRRLKEELQALVQHSDGSIVLSSGVTAFLADHDYERGTVRRQNVSLSDIVEKTIPLLDFDYFLEKGHVVICTYAEAGIRWQNWWNKYGRDLEYQKGESLFVLKRRE